MDSTLQGKTQKLRIAPLFSLAALALVGCATLPLPQKPIDQIADGCAIHDPNRGLTVVVKGCLESRNVDAEQRRDFVLAKAQLERKIAEANMICALSTTKPEFTRPCTAAIAGLTNSLIDKDIQSETMRTLKPTPSPSLR